MDQLEPGQVRKGVVSNLTSFGAFVDLGGADGLVHVSEISYNRVNHPSEVLRVGQEIDVMVLSVDRDSKKIALSLKKALPDPWTTVEERYHVGQVVPAVITKLAKFGAFAKVEEGLEGLIHLSELTDLPVQDAAQVVQEGQHVNVKIIHINNQRRRLGLSVRQAEESATPQSMQSFGDQDEYGSFSGRDFGDYSSANPTSALSPAQEDTEPNVEEAEIPAPEPGPEASVTSDNGNSTSNGDAPAEGISIEASEATPHNEHEGTEVASTASRRSANE
jgi:small subunit ribosomal protein S1